MKDETLALVRQIGFYIPDENINTEEMLADWILREDVILFNLGTHYEAWI
jgi:hypothetical protein